MQLWWFNTLQDDLGQVRLGARNDDGGVYLDKGKDGSESRENALDIVLNLLQEELNKYHDGFLI